MNGQVVYILIILVIDEKREIMLNNVKKLNSFGIIFLYGVNQNVLTLNMHRKIRIFAIGM